MHRGTGEKAERPFPGDTEDAEEEVYDLQDWYRFDDGIEVRCEEVPENLGPEEAFCSCSDLIYKTYSSEADIIKRSVEGHTHRGSEDNQASPVVLDELSHPVVWFADV